MLNELNELNEEQKVAVTHWGSPLLVMAGAGSGKTKVLTYRTWWLIKEKEVDPKKIVLLTFTNKAAEEMKARVGGLLGENVSLGFAGTFHAFGVRLLRKWGERIGLPHNFVIYDSGDQESAMKDVMKRMDGDPKKARMTLGWIGKLKNELITATAAREFARDYSQKQLLDYWIEYERILKENGAVDFDDLLVKTVELLKDDELRNKVNSDWEWILIDEYQDTNKAQFELTKELIGDKKQLTVVGDAAQAIYSFRGADFRNLSLLKNNLENLTIVELPKNYRSTQMILDAAWGVIRRNTGHKAIKLETAGNVGEKIELLEAKDEREESVWVVRKAEMAIGKGKTVAILYRTNSQSRTFEEELLARGVAYRLVGGVRFYDRAEIKDLLAYVKVVANDKDSVSWKRIEKLGKRKMEAFKNKLAMERETWVKLTPALLLEEIIEGVGFILKFDMKDEEDAARVENVKELLAVAGEKKSLEDFLEDVALIQSEELADRKDGSNSKVTLMTVHAAKGLEFDQVFIVGMEEGLFPHSRSLMEKDDMEEERRLMYVAITRAKEKLHISWARNRLVYGGRMTQTPSRFLMEIEENLIEKVGGIVERSKAPKVTLIDELGNKERRIVTDWELDLETKDDFAEIDSW